MLPVFIYNALFIITGLLLPAYQTFKVLRANKTDAFDTVLTKWVVIAIFASMCYLADIFVSWLPFYQDLKILCLLLLTVLREETISISYHRVIQPWLTRNEVYIDYALTATRDVYRAKTRELVRWVQMRAVAYMNERNKQSGTQFSAQNPSRKQPQTRAGGPSK